MDPRRLLTFRAVVRAGSISAGARELGWTQPAVSQQLAGLERAAGTPLLVRGPTGVVPTEAGAAVLRHAEAVDGALRAAREEVDDLIGLRSGTVRIAAFPSAGAVVVPAVAAALRERAVPAGSPGVQLRTEEAEPPEAVALVRSNDVHLALAFRYPGPVEAGDLVWHPLAQDPTRIVLPATRPPVDGLAALRDEAWVAGCARCRAHLLAACAAVGFTPDVRHVTDDYVAVQALVARGVAVALLPELALRAATLDGVRAHPDPALAPRTIGVLHRPGVDRVPAVAAVLTALRTTAG
ncbi:LysR family transcriptional regulator [Pseudonocardia kunmingensis]|uniref:DNA-binding transcriptional LysR family regulator n=1 Tax=Pseudonocardia kunmingensis TaxID=630975 RepID=A0A543D3S8_9PSEU|nr:LysR family transcriptional regulator [Pseudonocardia kunmingensis]TQM03996.1 DNA-binding transcriptional LysR family regulator [Pseudonocardia kunmingensis]